MKQDKNKKRRASTLALRQASAQALSEAGRAAFGRILLWVTLGTALVSLFLLFPFTSVFAANGITAASEIFSGVGRLLNAAGLFAVLGLMTLSVWYGERKLTRRLFLLEVVTLFLGTVGRSLLYLFFAFLDSVLPDAPFFFASDTLSHVLDGGGLFSVLSYTSVNALASLGICLVTFFALKAMRRRFADKSANIFAAPLPRRMLLLPVWIYLAFSLVSAVVETVMTVTSIGFSFGAGSFFALFLPYFWPVLVAGGGSVLLQKGVWAFEAKYEGKKQN